MKKKIGVFFLLLMIVAVIGVGAAELIILRDLKQQVAQQTSAEAVEEVKSEPIAKENTEKNVKETAAEEENVTVEESAAAEESVVIEESAAAEESVVIEESAAATESVETEAGKPLILAEPKYQDITLAVEKTYQLEIPAGVYKASVESSAPEVISVDKTGMLTALSAGSSRITLYLGEEKHPFDFNVVVTTPKISQSSIVKIVGGTEQISIMGTAGIPNFRSDNPAVASVSSTGLVTAEPTGSGQTTKIYVTVDGQEFAVDVTVEPVPQLLSTYKIYGEENLGTYLAANGRYVEYTNAKIELVANANEIARVGETAQYETWTDDFSHWEYQRRPSLESETVLDLGAEDFSGGNVYPLYRMYAGMSKENHIQIMLIGSSQQASVTAKDTLGQDVDGLHVSYTPCDGYGIIDVWGVCDAGKAGGSIISVLIDGHSYQFVVDDGVSEAGELKSGKGSIIGKKFVYNPSIVNSIPSNFVVQNLSIDSEQVVQNQSAASLRSTATTYYGSSNVWDTLGEKLMETVEDEAISKLVGGAFDLLF